MDRAQYEGARTCVHHLLNILLRGIFFFFFITTKLHIENVCLDRDTRRYIYMALWWFMYIFSYMIIVVGIYIYGRLVYMLGVVLRRAA